MAFMAIWIVRSRRIVKINNSSRDYFFGYNFSAYMWQILVGLICDTWSSTRYNQLGRVNLLQEGIHLVYS